MYSKQVPLEGDVSHIKGKLVNKKRALLTFDFERKMNVMRDAVLCERTNIGVIKSHEKDF